MNRKVYSHIANLFNSATTTTNEYWKDAWHQILIEVIDTYLPRGSGFDSGCYLDFEKSSTNKLVINCDYHHMTEHGYYDEWSYNKIVITPDLRWEFNMKLVNMKGGKRLKDYDREYFIDTLNYHLNQEVDIYEIVNKYKPEVKHA
jgi:hypothetical protein